MFALTMGPGMDMAFPDVCLTPSGPVPAPVPYPNIAQSATSLPVVPNVLIAAMPSLNKLSLGMVSNGDEAGVLLGVVSHLEAGQTQYMVGCATIMVGGAPAQRLTSVTGQNSMGVLPNASGVCLAPSQTTVLTLG